MRRYALCLLLCAASPAWATDFYVDPVSGSDTGDGSPANPWRTLQAVIQANLVETRNWASLPYVPGASLVTINAGAPVKAGDTLWLRTGYHGAVEISGAYNAAPITIAAATGHAPRLRSLLVRSAQHWILRGLSISPSHAPPLSPITIVSLASHSWSGPAWDIEIHDSEIFTVADSSAWTAADWVGVASSGVSVSGDRVSVRGCRLRNVRFGISVSGDDARIQGNLVDGFSADGLRGLGDNGLFEYNRVQNNYVTDAQGDANHDDGFQSWSVGAGGVGTGEVRGVTLRGNVFINATNPSHPLRSTMQAIGCFDGLFVDWLVENNVVITDHWHGISFYGMWDSRIVNNTVIDLVQGSPGPPWIMVTAHKDGRPSQNVVVRNNLATDFSLAGTNIVADHNLEFTNAMAATLFAASPFDLHLRSGSAAIDAGSSVLAPALDVERVSRPQGAAVDLGAYEWGGPPILVTPAVIPAGTVAVAYSQAFTQTGATGPVTWSLTGTLPDGVAFEPSTAVLSGTPTEPGSFWIQVTATQAGPYGGSASMALVVNRVAPFVPTALVVDPAGNSVLEESETVAVEPFWRNTTGGTESVTGAASDFTGVGDAPFAIPDGAADYGSVANGASAGCASTTGDCYALTLGRATYRPARHWDVRFKEALSGGDGKHWLLHVGGSFYDVPAASGFYRFVETLLHKGVTGGCSADAYCPTTQVTREQMSVFVLVGKEGAGYLPAACGTPVFADVPASSPFCRYIEDLSRRGVVSGCGGGRYCPTSPVTREQMSVFLLVTLDPTLNPPACAAPPFADVPISSPFCRWISVLSQRGITGGCGGGSYCPTSAVTREQMAVFVTATFALSLYGP